MQSFFLQDEFGQVNEASSISAGLDYPGVGPEHAHLSVIGRARYDQVNDDQVVEAVQLLARTEGIICALESAHAIAWLVAHKPELKGSSIVVTLSGRGDKDAETIAERLGFLEGGHSA
jgi:tryptophan synthase beta chain